MSFPEFACLYCEWKIIKCVSDVCVSMCLLENKVRKFVCKYCVIDDDYWRSFELLTYSISFVFHVLFSICNDHGLQQMTLQKYTWRWYLIEQIT